MVVHPRRRQFQNLQLSAKAGVKYTERMADAASKSRIELKFERAVVLQSRLLLAIQRFVRCHGIEVPIVVPVALYVNSCSLFERDSFALQLFSAAMGVI